ncbi:MAG TPA: cobalamin-dependent protein, partial [Gemmataceae bacterium]|nr:cobalamin-dependent protein [Gemmataceae bacterium]
VPEVGAAFLRDHLERLGARVGVVKLRREEFGRRLAELLGADVVGIGVYVHNRAEVAELVQELRAAGFTGKVVLGGPETRNIEAVQEAIPGWDAIIRGEGEEVLPRVLEFFDLLDAGEWQAALDRAQALRGVALRHGETVLLCDTAARNRAEAISCPLPFDWGRGAVRRRLKMNFTRGCPYRCTFCPNHQGRGFRSGEVDELWRYTVFAVADDLPLPDDMERAVAGAIQGLLGVTAPPRLRLALHLLTQAPITGADLRAILTTLRPVIDARVWSDAGLLESLIGLGDTVESVLERLGDGPVGPWQFENAWLLAKAAVLASRQLWRREGSHGEVREALRAKARPPFVLETSEDNTLVNRKQITEYLRRRKAYGLAGDVIFNPGQNTVQDLLQGHDRDEANEEYIALLADENPFAVALGTDGPSNAILRQNQKPAYGVAGLLAVNRALGRYAREVANNYILLTPETDFLEAVESFALFLLLPVPWRDYGEAINLRVIKEETTLATDEGLLFAPDDVGHQVPFRSPEVARLLERWGLTSEVPTDRLRPLLWRILENDAEVRAALPLLVERWRRNFDSDPEIAALAELVRRELRSAESVAHALWRLAERVQREALVDGRTRATFRDLLRPTLEPCWK